MRFTQLKVLALAGPLLVHSTVAALKRPLSLRARDDDIHSFEERFIDTMEYDHHNTSIKLVGYKKIIMSSKEVEELEQHIDELPLEWDEISSAYYDSLERVMRIYFPVENALVYHNDKLVEANHLGEFEHSMIQGDCAVVGRYKTAEVHGVPANRIEDGIIYLEEPSPVLRKHGNVHVVRVTSCLKRTSCSHRFSCSMTLDGVMACIATTRAS